MTRNGKQSPARARIELQGSSASPQEAAAVVAAIEQFLHDTAPAPAPAAKAPAGWARAGLFEGVGLPADSHSPWAS